MVLSNLFKNVILKKIFIGSRSNFSSEDSVVCVDIGLRAAAKVAVESMAHFVSQGRNAVVAALVVQKNEGVDTVNAPGICARALTLIFINIYPAFC